MNPSINYILTQLSTDEASKKRILGMPNISIQYYDLDADPNDEFCISVPGSGFDYESAPEVLKVAFIRTALSRIDDKAVLSGLEGETEEKEVITIDINNIKKLQELGYWVDSELATDTGYLKLEVRLPPYCKESPTIFTQSKSKQLISNILYEAFDYPLRNGQGLDRAIEALDKKMKELNLIPTT